MELCCDIGISVYEIACTLILVSSFHVRGRWVASACFNLACAMTVFLFSTFDPHSATCPPFYYVFVALNAIVFLYVNVVDRFSIGLLAVVICVVGAKGGVKMWGIGFLQAFSCILLWIGIVDSKPRVEDDTQIDCCKTTQTASEVPENDDSECLEAAQETTSGQGDNVGNPMHANIP